MSKINCPIIILIISVNLLIQYPVAGSYPGAQIQKLFRSQKTLSVATQMLEYKKYKLKL